MRNVANQVAVNWGTVKQLYNDAGVLLDSIYLYEHGNEMHFEVNTLAPFLLSTILWEPKGKSSNLKIVNHLFFSLLLPFKKKQLNGN